MKPFYITTPIYYVNDKPHIGHAYTTIAADVLARWKRLCGERVFFLTGTDEHGSKIHCAAEASKVSPQEYVDRLVLDFEGLWKLLKISNDDFIRTTQSRHTQLVQAVFKKLYDQGDIIKGVYEDWYCVLCESFWLENQLVAGKCPDCGRAVEKLKEESYFFKLSQYESRLLEHYQENPEFLSPKYRGEEMIQFVKSGLKDISVSRLKEKWGIPLPMNSQGTVYVWFDALLNYLSAIGFNAETNSYKNEVWPCDIHFVGKEIFRFHSVIWPAMLMALNLPLPRKVFAHGWWTAEGEKMSKSRGNVVDPVDVVKEYGLDSFRYFLLREIPFGADGDFSQKALRTRYNSELANDFGNLASRCLTMIEKNFDGLITSQPEGKFLVLIQEKNIQIQKGFDQLHFHEVLAALLDVVKEANRNFEQSAPWALVKTDLPKAAQVLAETVVVLRWLAIGFSPFMPEIAERLWAQLGEKGSILERGKEILQNPLSNFSEREKVHKEGVLFPRKV